MEKNVIGLALVPIEEVENVFCLLCEEKPKYQQLELFADYVLETYIETNVFPPFLWNYYDHDGKRSNNDIEGYNKKLNNFFPNHPNIWVFITKLQAEEATATLKFIRIEKDTLKQRGRNKVDVTRDLEIQTCKCELLAKKIDLLEYLNKVSDGVHDYSKNKLK
jgi:hypothetical protein